MIISCMMGISVTASATGYTLSQIGTGKDLENDDEIANNNAFTIIANGIQYTYVIALYITEDGLTYEILNSESSYVDIDWDLESGKKWHAAYDSDSNTVTITQVSSSTTTIAAPTISGTTPFEDSTTVTISCDITGASIYYTTNGDTPTSSSTHYTSAFTLTDTATVRAIAIKDNVLSEVASSTFTCEGGSLPPAPSIPNPTISGTTPFTD